MAVGGAPMAAVGRRIAAGHGLHDCAVAIGEVAQGNPVRRCRVHAQVMLAGGSRGSQAGFAMAIPEAART